MSSQFTRRPAGRYLLPLLSVLAWTSAVEAAQQGNVTLPTGENATSTQLLVLPASSTYPIWNVTGPFLLQHAIVKDWSSLQPSQAQADAPFGEVLALPWMLMSGGAITFLNVNISTSCQTLDVLQRAACTSLPLEQLAALEVGPGRLMVRRWLDNHVTAQNLTFTCNASSYSASSLPAEHHDGSAPLPPATASCAVAHVSTWQDLVYQSTVLQTWANNVTIVLDANITIAPSVAEQPDQHIDVYRHMDITGTGPLLYMNLGFIHGEGLWQLISKDASITFQGITFLTLPLGPQEKFPMSVLPWGMWSVHMERCHLTSTPLVLRNCVLITNAETMDYASHWASEFLSVFPDRQSAAQWYGEDPTCRPRQNRSLLGQQWWPQLKLQDQHTWVARNATTLGVQLVNTTLTSQKPAGLDFVSSGLQLTKLFEQDPYLPFPEITWVTDAAAFVDAFKEQRTTYIAVLGNISIDQALWGPQPIELKRDLIVAGWPNKRTVIDWQGAVKVVQLNKHMVKMRNLVLMNGGQGGPDAVPGWARNLTLYQWPLMYDWAESSLQLQNVMIIVPQSEYNILSMLNHRGQDHRTVSPDAPIGSSRAEHLSGLAWTQTANFSDRQCVVPLLVENGIVGVQTVVSSAPIAFPLLARDVVLASYPSFSNSNTAGPGLTGSGNAHQGSWKLVLAIVLPLSACATAILAGAMWAVRHRRRRLLAKAKERCMSGEKPLLGTGSDWGTGAGTGNLLGASPGASHLATSNGLLATCHTMTLAPQVMPVSDLSSMHSAHGSPSQGQLIFHVHSPTASLHQASREAAALARSQPASHTSHLSDHSQNGMLGAGRHNSQAQCSSGQTTASQSQAGIAPAGSYGNTGPSTPLQQPTLPQWVEQGGPELLSSMWDSFDVPPTDPNALLINKLNMSSDQHTPSIAARASGEHDVASQLKGIVSRMQEELGEQEVQITRVLGQGGGGVVYQGLWRGLTVAVKSLVFTSLPDRPISRHQQRAMTEAAICRTLHHPNIVATYSYDLQALQSVRPTASTKSHDLQQHNSSKSGSHTSSTPVLGTEAGVYEYKLHIIQEFCDGGTLKSLIDSGKLQCVLDQGQSGPSSHDTPLQPDLASVLQLAVDVVLGMAHVHSRNIVHGDLTPANVLLRSDSQSASKYIAKVSDFGLSWKLQRGQEHVSNARQGTTCYIPPEVLHVGIMSRAADVWSFGMILHEMYHGTPSWRKKHRLCTDPTLLAASVPWAGSEHLCWSPTCPPALRALITSCTASDPASRPSFNSVLNKLRAMQSQLTGVDSSAGMYVTTAQALLSEAAGASEVAPCSPSSPASCPGGFLSPTIASCCAAETALGECSSAPLDFQPPTCGQSTFPSCMHIGPGLSSPSVVDDARQHAATDPVLQQAEQVAVPAVKPCTSTVCHQQCGGSQDSQSQDNSMEVEDVAISHGNSTTLQGGPTAPIAGDNAMVASEATSSAMWKGSHPSATKAQMELGADVQNGWVHAALIQVPPAEDVQDVTVPVQLANMHIACAGQSDAAISSNMQELLCCTFGEYAAEGMVPNMQERESVKGGCMRGQTHT